MNPFETFECETQKHHEQFHQRVDKLNQDFNRDVKRVLCLGGAALIAAMTALWLAAWLLT